MVSQAGALILGAGFSRRFGSDKRLHKLGKLSIAEVTVSIYQQVFEHVRVIIRPEDRSLAELLSKLNVELVESRNAQLGIGHSLADGIRDLKWTWAFVGLLDMPFIKAQTLNQLLRSSEKQKSDQTKIIRPRVRDQSQKPAHPVAFHRSLFCELTKSQGDSGAKELLTKYKDLTQFVDSIDTGLWRDIDSPNDITAEATRLV